MPRASNKFDPPVDFKVFIRDSQGRYLAEDDFGLFFSYDRTRALILNYRADRVEAQLAAIRDSEGIALSADPVPPEEIYETCDGCKELFLPFMMCFDGKNFFCPDCRQRRSGRRPPAQQART